MYKVRAFTTELDGHEVFWPQRFTLYPEEVSAYSKEVATTLALFRNGQDNQAPDGFLIEDSDGTVITRQDVAE